MEKDAWYSRLPVDDTYLGVTAKDGCCAIRECAQGNRAFLRSLTPLDGLELKLPDRTLSAIVNEKITF